MTRKLQHAAARIVEVRWAGSEAPLSTTWLHPVLTKRGWVRAGRLVYGDRAILPDGSFREVTSVDLTDRVEPVFNLFTAGEHNFVAGGVVVHNFIVLPHARAVLHRLLIDPAPDTCPAGAF